MLYLEQTLQIVRRIRNKRFELIVFYEIIGKATFIIDVAFLFCDAVSSVIFVFDNSLNETLNALHKLRKSHF